ncbi:MAG: cytochrome c [Ignavibacteriaceae bacterium]
MTKSQIWVASFLVLFLLLFFLGRVSKNVESGEQKTTNPLPQTNSSSKELSAPELITQLGCVNCHGPDLSGTKLGPSLQNVKEFWSRDKLINYLRNPNSYMDSERFK